MNLHQLETFITVADQKSFAKAAQKLYITQPAITQQMHKLESELGFSLFARCPQGVQLTDAGALFLDGVQQMLSIYHRTTAACSRLEHKALSLSVSYISEINLPILSSIMNDFQTRFPDCDFHFTRIRSNQIVSNLLEHQSDLVFTPFDFVAQQSAITFHPLYQEQYYCVLHKNHSLSHNTQLSYQQLAETILLLPAPDYCLPHINRVFSELKQQVPFYQKKMNMSIDSAYIQLLSADTVAIMPGYMRPTHPDLISIPLQTDLRVSFGIAASQSLDEFEQAFVDISKEHFHL